MSSIYIAKLGESIWDVTLNATGAIMLGDVNNLDEILTANDFDDWNPVLGVGQSILIPDSVNIDPNALQQLQLYPVCNNTVNDLLDKINATFGIMSNNWIMATGFWNDNAVWIDGNTWIDSL